MYNQNLFPTRTKNWHNSTTVKKVPPAHAKRVYRLVWAKKVTLAAICLDISSASFGIRINYNVSMYHVPVPMYNDIFVWTYILNSYFQLLAASFFDIRGQGISKVSWPNSYIDLEICMAIYFKKLVCVAGSIIFGIWTSYAAIGITYQFLHRITNLYDYILNS